MGAAGRACHVDCASSSLIESTEIAISTRPTITELQVKKGNEENPSSHGAMMIHRPSKASSHAVHSPKDMMAKTATMTMAKPAK